MCDEAAVRLSRPQCLGKVAGCWGLAALGLDPGASMVVTLVERDRHLNLGLLICRMGRTVSLESWVASLRGETGKGQREDEVWDGGLYFLFPLSDAKDKLRAWDGGVPGGPRKP